MTIVTNGDTVNYDRGGVKSTAELVAALAVDASGVPQSALPPGKAPETAAVPTVDAAYYTVAAYAIANKGVAIFATHNLMESNSQLRTNFAALLSYLDGQRANIDVCTYEELPWAA